MLIALNKPFGVLSQFTDGAGRATLADFVRQSGVYPCGRLDRDSEGLLLLTDNGAVQAYLSQPKNKITKTYFAQVEGIPNEDQIGALRNGITLKDGPTKPAKARPCPVPEWLWPRTPPIRERKTVADSWLEITLTEGRNRQVRRMTAHVGLPTLRLIRYAIGPYTIDGLGLGETRTVTEPEGIRKRRVKYFE